MKFLQSGLIRALCAIIVGGLIIEYREQTVTWITIAIGILFFLSGVISCASYWSARRHQNDPQVFSADGRQLTGFTPTFPIVGVGSMILGLILAVMPNVFVAWLMYILAAILILGAVSQFVILASARRLAHIGWGFWLMPSVILLTGIVAVAFPQTVASSPLLVIGWCMVLYGVIEIINTIKVRQLRRAMEKAAAKAETVETAETIEEDHAE